MRLTDIKYRLSGAYAEARTKALATTVIKTIASRNGNHWMSHDTAEGIYDAVVHERRWYRKVWRSLR